MRRSETAVGGAIRLSTVTENFDAVCDPEHYELRHAGKLVPVEPRVFDLLAYLVQHPGRTVTTEELLEQLYPNQFAPVDRLTNAVTQWIRTLD
jgi:DNA-binding winged helix-turn-helix (wHTH) protein